MENKFCKYLHWILVSPMAFHRSFVDVRLQRSYLKDLRPLIWVNYGRQKEKAKEIWIEFFLCSIRTRNLNSGCVCTSIRPIFFAKDYHL
ncbi:hypothetical protein R1flu_005230 [Riccia fluitans]|uniref:Uncharacterized protein n=1 Tax=Riccia fluitans TaxID=41844 RepID=A0ABD1YSK7_9MARC